MYKYLAFLHALVVAPPRGRVLFTSKDQDCVTESPSVPLVIV